MFIYGMRSRYFSMGTFPKKDFRELLEKKDLKEFTLNRSYYDFISYDRQLTEEEVYQYELDFIGIK